jgi:hypothetical protein
VLDRVYKGPHSVPLDPHPTSGYRFDQRVKFKSTLPYPHTYSVNSMHGGVNRDCESN